MGQSLVVCWNGLEPGGRGGIHVFVAVSCPESSLRIASGDMQRAKVEELCERNHFQMQTVEKTVVIPAETAMVVT